MKHLKSLLLVLLLASPAFADVGYFERADCGTLSPETNKTVCLQSTTVNGRTAGTLYVYTGSWVAVSTAGGSGAVDGSGAAGHVTYWSDADTLTGEAAFAYDAGTNTLTAGTFSGNLTGDVTGNVSGSSGSTTGNAATATALASNPTDCTVQGAYADTIAASGNLTCDILIVTSAADPTADDDTGDGYIIGTMWINTTSDTVFHATDVTLTAAVWAKNSQVVAHDDLTELDDDDHSAIYVKYESSAGVPAAGSCDRDGQAQFDTTNSKLYACYSVGGNPVDVGTQSDGYSQVTGESGSATASGAATLNISCTPNCTTAAADASPDTLVITISDHVKSAFFPANALTTDGTQCANPALATINSGPRIYTILCADNDASTIYGHTTMIDSWVPSTTTFELSYVQTAADTGALNADIAVQCRSPGDTINNTWGTEIAIDDAAVTGSNAVDHTTSAAVTGDGPCAAGDSLFFRLQLDAAGTTTAVATLHILGIKMEYSVLGAGSD